MKIWIVTIVLLIIMVSCVDNPDDTTALPKKVSLPVFSPQPGVIDKITQVTISCATSGAIIKYTTDGSDPSKSDKALQSTTVNVDKSMTVRTYAYLNGWNESNIADGKYRIDYLPITLLKRDMVRVPGGKFNQKATGGTPDNFNHTIFPFVMAKYETTYELWYTVRIWAESKGYTFANKGREGHDGADGAAPTAGTLYELVTMVNWRDAMVWCNAYSEMAGYTPIYYTDAEFNDGLKASTNTEDINKTLGSEDNPYVNWNGDGYRLPTEGEWQYAASYIDGKSWTPFNYASGATKDYTDATADKIVAWYGDNAGGISHVVGTKNSNHLGIHDMSGNVWEWCWDWYGDYPQQEQTNYHGISSGSNRILRDGSWDVSAYFLQVGFRYSSYPCSNYSFVGFRPVRIE